MTTYRIEVRKNEYDNGYWFRIVHKNGQIIATSETYTRKASAVKSANRLVSRTVLDNIAVIDKTQEAK